VFQEKGTPGQPGHEYYVATYDAEGNIVTEDLIVTTDSGTKSVSRGKDKNGQWVVETKVTKVYAEIPVDCSISERCGGFSSAAIAAQVAAMRSGAAGSTVNPDRNGDGFVSPCAGQASGSGGGAIVSGSGGGSGGDSFGSAGQSTAKCGQELATSAATSGLVTNPGVAGGLGASGGPAMQDRTFTTTTGAGVITPTNDQNISGQGRQDDPGDFFGKKPTASLTPPSGTTGDDKDKDNDKDDEDKDNQSGSSQPPPK
jgi:hypothetical protein